MKQTQKLSVYSLIVSLIVVLGSSSSVYATPTFEPAGLNPGDQYRLVFVTAGLIDATSPNIADYNSFVTTQANLSGSLVKDASNDWRAIGSTTSISARDNTGTDPTPAGFTGVPIYQILSSGSSIITANYDDLWGGTNVGQINFDQFSGFLSERVWTGTEFDGTTSTGFELGATGGSSRFGITTGSPGLISFGVTTSSTQYRLYALSPVLTAVPEPTAATLLCLSTLACLLARRS